MIAAIWGMPARREDGVVAEDAAEVVVVGEDLVLHREEDARGIDEVDEREVVVRRDLLGAEDFLDRHREERARLHGGVVGDDHHPAAGDEPMPVTTPADGAPPHSAYIPWAAQRPSSRNGASGVDQVGDPLAGGLSSLLVLTFDRLAPAAEPDHVLDSAVRLSVAWRRFGSAAGARRSSRRASLVGKAWRGRSG